MTAVDGRDIGNERQRRRIEYLHAAGFVVGDGDEPAVLRDRAADAVAGLHDAFDDAAAQDIDLGQTAVAAEHIGITRIARVHHRGMRQIAESGDLRRVFYGRCCPPPAHDRWRVRSPRRDRRCRAASAQALSDRRRAAAVAMHDLNAPHRSSPRATVRPASAASARDNWPSPWRHGRIGPSIENCFDQEFIGLAGEIGG